MNEARERYDQELREIKASLAKIQRIDGQLTTWRTVLFFLLVLGLVLLMASGQSFLSLVAIPFWAGVLAFLVIASVHESWVRRREVETARSAFYQRLLARLDRDWVKLGDGGYPITRRALNEQPLAEDLNIFGQRSLFAWMSLATTQLGRDTLADWLMTWREPAILEDRLKAAIELRDQIELREEIGWKSAFTATQRANPDAFLQWVNSDDWWSNHRWVRVMSWVGPGILCLGIVLACWSIATGGSLPQSFVFAVIGLGLLINVGMTISALGPVHDIFHKVSSGHHAAYSMRSLFELMERLPARSPLLEKIHRDCFEADRNVLNALGRLETWLHLANLQRHVWSYLPYLLLQLFFLWDFHVLKLLTRWQATYRSYAAQWMDCLGIAEAILSAAAIHYENPGWSHPVWSNDPSKPIDVHGIGHPLMIDSQRVGNDLLLEGSRPMLLVTGSNMSGKSTFLRTLGVNSILARTGAAVCSREFRIWPFEVTTSIHIQDNLHEGISFFMAELYRLRTIVDLAKRIRAAGSYRLLVLLDEILQGTNSRERLIAVVHILDQLLEQGAIIAVTTHDLDLASSDELIARSQVVHFREYFEGEGEQQTMRFDYVMRSGVAPTTNALKLLKLVGL